MWQRMLWARRKLASWGHRLASPEWRRRILVPFHLFGIPLLVYAMPIILQGIDNLRLIEVFSTDEALAVSIVTNMIEHRSLVPGLRGSYFFNYGALYFYLSLLLVAAYTLVFPAATTPAVILSLRSTTVLFGVLSLCATYLLARTMYSGRVSLLASLLLVVTPNFLEWSVTAHPDIPQMFFTILAIYYCYRLVLSYSVKTLILASLFAGLSFGTKYAGFLLLPVIGLSNVLSLVKNMSRDSLSWRALLRKLVIDTILVVLVFGIVFIATNPFAILKYDKFIADLTYERRHLAFGHGFRASSEAVEWFDLLASDRIMTSAGFALLFAGLSIWWFSSIRRQEGGILARFDGSSVVLFWIVLYFFYLFFQVNMRQPRFLLPIVPFLVIFAAYGAIRLLSSDFRFLPLNLVIKGVVIVLILLSLGPRIVEGYEFFKIRAGKMQDNPVIAAREWLEANYPPETGIVYDSYSYIPPQFETILRSWGQTEALVADVDPDIIVVNRTISKRFIDPNRATDYVDGPEAYLAIHEFYARLEAEEFPCFHLTKDFGAVRIYERTPRCVNQ